MATIGVLTFSDGRSYTHEPQIEENLAFQSRLVDALQAAGHAVVAGDLVWSNETARSEGRKLAERGVDATIFNYAVWAFPQFSVMASHFVSGPILLLGQVNPAKPGMVSVLAAAGALEQLGIEPKRVFGDIGDEKIFKQVDAWANAAGAVGRLRGETYGLFGGRSIGINTAVSNTDQWAKQFGVDVEHVDQWEIVRRSADISPEKVSRARQWLESHVAKIYYDGKQLTPELLERQIASYYALREIITEKDLDFLGIKAQTELTENFVTTDLAEAFLNDPYDFDGPHDPIVCSTEADMDAALTMQIMKHITGTPVFFADVRHYLAEHDVMDLVNSGQHATYFAGRSTDPKVNLKNVELRPQGFYFPAGGAAVFHIAHPGRVTLGRLGRKDGQYRMHILQGEFVRLESQEEERIINEVQWNWPHAFAKLDCTIEAFLGNFPANHIHGVYGDIVPELRMVCEQLGIEPVLL